jgi:phenylalanyl-tRNA synthetase beta chain
MKISYNWLKDYLALSVDAHELAGKLSLRGLEVEEVMEYRIDFPNVVVGKVISMEAHPNADKLKICVVDTDMEHLAIVCGAPNVQAGQKVVVAKEGASLPNGLKIQRSKIRGQDSQGMICSREELGLENKSEGIWVLPDDLKVGLPLHRALNFETDYILDIAVTPNRPDCLSHLGVAREIGALLQTEVVKPSPVFKEGKKLAQDEVTISIECPETCPRYSARLIREINVGPSPGWLVKRLEAVGMRSINNVVDITNYVMLETGQPLHAFDFDLILHQRIIVRESVENEKFVTLDDKSHTLKKGTVLICDGERPVAIGGIMGGLNSEVSQHTRHILLESAYFKPENIQKSSRYLGLTTEASQRFERGTDPNGVPYAADRASQLIAEICGGQIYKEIVDVYPRTIESKTIPLKTEKINNLLGTRLSSQQMIKLLQPIGLKIDEGSIVIPTFRPDLERVADIAEEVARLYGLDHIPANRKCNIYYNIQRNELDYFTDILKNILTGMGFQEIVTGSMINSETWSLLTDHKIYPILNPISKDMSGMRNSLVPSMAQVIQHNINRRKKDLRLFEINRIFIPKEDLEQPPVEEKKLALAICGKRDGGEWYSSEQYVDFYDIKGIVESFLSKISLDNWHFISYSHFAVDIDSLAVVAGKKPIGFFGRIAKRICDFYELGEDVFVAEISISDLMERRQVNPNYQQIPRFPASERDLAFILDEETTAGEVEKTIREQAEIFLTEIKLFDIYRGKQIEEGKKSLAFRLTFQSPEKTLNEEEINRSVLKIIQGVSKVHNAKLREL